MSLASSVSTLKVGAERHAWNLQPEVYDTLHVHTGAHTVQHTQYKSEHIKQGLQPDMVNSAELHVK